MATVDLEKLQKEALKLDPQARASLASTLLESLENLSEDEAARLWAEEAQRREADLEAHSEAEHSAEEVFREARAKLK